MNCVEKIVSYINSLGNPFMDTQDAPRNFATGKQIDDFSAQMLTNSVAIGEREYAEFKETRLQKKTVELFDVIKNVKWTNSQT